MAGLGNFNANQVEPATDFEPIPAGKYVAVITKSEMKDTKAGNGKYLELVFQVLEGEHKNRQLWARLNLENPNELAVKIARAELSSICRAVNVMEPKDSMELHNLPLVIKVTQKEGEDGIVRNEIKAYAKKGPVIDNVVAQPTANTTAPWGKKNG